MYTAINLYGVLAMENGPPGLTGTAHAIVALAANGEKCRPLLSLFFILIHAQMAFIWFSSPHKN